MIDGMTTLMATADLLLGEGGGGGGGGGLAPQGGGNLMFIGLIMAIAVFWIITMRGSSRDKKQRQAMLDNLGKSDKVLTIGGIVGTVVAVKGDEVVVKVDEGSNTKLTFTRSAIQKVLSDEGKDGDRK
ncbi:MAG: preprotein translocase subunit YajC [Phycisphaerae bacterium]|nr:preprotein translocase subunit YajC [Phycisphaerae bacterium]